VGNDGRLHLIWEALPLAIIAATAAYLATSYAAAPAIIPMHFDIAGNPNQYAPKTIGSYFLVVWVQLGLEVLLTGMTMLVVGSKALPGPAENRFRRWWPKPPRPAPRHPLPSFCRLRWLMCSSCW